ncbi:hypothetical protein SDC9_104601 [bioreactor metagenome]|uniref:Uncharacterized protein n=1 Tax=bioreactor metagenome TaxID=1076179 RepID=A0A645AYE2_9ZZZZ
MLLPGDEHVGIGEIRGGKQHPLRALRAFIEKAEHVAPALLHSGQALIPAFRRHQLKLKPGPQGNQLNEVRRYAPVPSVLVYGLIGVPVRVYAHPHRAASRDVRPLLLGQHNGAVRRLGARGGEGKADRQR